MSKVQTSYRGAFVDGEFLDTSEEFVITNPATGEEVARVAESGKEGVNAALESSKQAQEAWAAMDPAERGRRLRNVADLIRKHLEDLAETTTLEIGRPIQQSKGLIGSTADYFDYYGGLPDKIEGETIPVPGEQQAFTRKEPLGVSAQIIPWNAPVLLCARGIAPAMAAGNAVVVKPAPEAPLGIIQLAEIASEAGIPDGVLNVVPGDGVNTGAALTGDARIDQLTFTGSVATGQLVGEAAMKQMIPLAMELGGKSPAIVFDDANIDDAVAGAVKALSMLSGQVCFATTRVFVHEDIYDTFRESLISAVDSLTIGPGLEGPDLGPLISEQALEKASRYVEEATANGAEAITGGSSVERDGNFYLPTVIEGAADDAAISCEEVFGPVINLYAFSSEEEVIERANDTEFGLYATLWTNRLDRGHRVANQIESGSVMVNQYAGSYPQTPFGGYKKSGFGREKGMQAVEHYTQLKTINIAYGTGSDDPFDA